MRNRLLAGLLAGFMLFQSAGTAFAADDAAGLVSTGTYGITEAASDGASLVMSESGSEASSGSSGESADEASTEATLPDEAGEGSTPDEYQDDEPSDASSSESASSESASDEGSDASSEASGGASDDDSAVEASSEASRSEDFYEEHPTGFLDYDKPYEVESILDNPRPATKGLFRSAPVTYPSRYITPNLPNLRNQSPYGTCWAFASVGLAEINLLKNGYTGFDLSELHLVYFAYHSQIDPLGGTREDYSTFSGTAYLDMGGNYDFAATTFMRWTGAADEALVPYSSGATVKQKGLDPSLAYNDVVHLTGYYEDKYDSSNVTPVKKMIMDYGAAGINFYAYNSMTSATSKKYYNEDNNCYYNPSTSGANHAVIVVGWDDEFSKDNFSTTPPGDGAWLIRNSWTTGNYENNKSYSGYFWMSYYEGTIDEDVSAMECVPLSMSHDNNYQYDGGLGLSSMGLNNSLTVAQMFTASADTAYGEMLDTVAFLTTSAGAAYTIDVYTDVTEPGNPYSGVHQENSTTTGTTEFGGFYTVPLSEAVYLEKGESFAIVINLKKPGDVCWMGTEYGPHYSSYNLDAQVGSGEKQSLYYNGVRWVDYGYEHDTNFRIKAYTDDLHQAPVRPESVTFTNIENNKLKLKLKEGFTANALVFPENATKKTLVWTTSDPGIATVTQDGYVYGVSDGRATITATTVFGKVSASFTVESGTVLDSIRIDVKEKGASLDVGSTRTYTVIPDPAAYKFRGEVTWESSDPDIVSVDSTGKVKALRVGWATITASVDDETTSEKIYSLANRSKFGTKVGNDNTVRIWWKDMAPATEFRIYNKDKELLATLDADETEYVDHSYNSRAMSAYSVAYYFGYVVDGEELRSTVSAQLKARYKINYVIEEGGVQNEKNPDYYTKGIGAELFDPTPPEGTVFVGWYADSSYTTPKTSISTTDTDTITLYARFEKAHAAGIEIISDHDKINAGSSITVAARVISEFEGVIPDDVRYTLSVSCVPEDAAEYTEPVGDTPEITITGRRQGYVSVTAVANEAGKDGNELTATAVANEAGKDGNELTATKRFLIEQFKPERLKLSVKDDGGAEPAEVVVGDNLTITAVVTPENADPYVTWSSSDESVVSVEELTGDSARISALSAGTAYITAVSVVDASVTVSHRIVVEGSETPGKELRITDTSKSPKLYGSSSDDTEEAFEKIELAAGKSFALKAEMLPGDTFTDKNVFWSSGNAAVASVSAAGKLTAISAGSTVISVRSEESGLMAACRVYVYDPVKSFALDKKTLKLGQKQTGTISVATLLPTTASDEVTFESSRTDIATVDGSGVVTAGSKNGTTVITVKTAHGEKSAKCTVTVGNPVTGISVTSKGNATALAAGKSLQLTAVFNGGKQSPQPINKGVEWQIIDGEHFASINQKGVLTGIKEGRVTVRAVSTTDQVAEDKLEPIIIDVYVPVTKAAFSAGTINMIEGGEYTLSFKVYTPGGESPTGLELGDDIGLKIVHNDDTTIRLTKHADGTYNIYARKYTGKQVQITATYYPYEKKGQKVTCVCKVNVLKPTTRVSKFALSKTKLSMDRGTVADITGSFTPMVPGTSEVYWTISDESALCFVDEDGHTIDAPTTEKVRIKAIDDPEEVEPYSKKTVTLKATTAALDSKGKPLTSVCTVTILGKAAVIDVKPLSDPSGVVTVAKGKSVALKTVVYADEGKTVKAGNQKVTWYSKDTSIATVSNAGKVVGVKPGSTIIWVDSANDYGSSERSDAAESIEVHVYAAPSKVTLDKTKTTMSTKVGDDTRYSSLRHYEVITAGITPSDFFGNPKELGDDYKKITWTANSSNIKVQPVETARFNQYNNSDEQQDLLSVLGDYRDISDGSSVVTGAGQSLAIMATEPGVVKLTATACGGKKAVCTITVRSHVTGLTVAEGRITKLEESDKDDYTAELTLNNSKLKTVTATALLEIGGVPYSAGKKTPEEKAATAAYNAIKKLAASTAVNYRSSNPSVATVNAKGIITAVSAGEAVITVSAADGSDPNNIKTIRVTVR